jgi:hypothetical protein
MEQFGHRIQPLMATRRDRFAEPGLPDPATL